MSPCDLNAFWSYRRLARNPAPVAPMIAKMLPTVIPATDTEEDMAMSSFNSTVTL